MVRHLITTCHGIDLELLFNFGFTNFLNLWVYVGLCGLCVFMPNVESTLPHFQSFFPSCTLVLCFKDYSDRNSVSSFPCCSTGKNPKDYFINLLVQIR